MVVMFSVARVLALLGVCPATHLLQATRWVPSLNQAQGLWGKQEGANKGKVKDTLDSTGALLRGRTLRPRATAPLLEIASCLHMAAAGTQRPLHVSLAGTIQYSCPLETPHMLFLLSSACKTVSSAEHLPIRSTPSSGLHSSF